MDAAVSQVAGDFGPGVVGAEGFLVDVFLKDIAQHVGVDFVRTAAGGVVQVPGETGKKVKDAFECRVGHMQRFAKAQGVVSVLFQLVGQKQAAVKVGDLPRECLGLWAAVGLGLGKGFKKQGGQKLAIEKVGTALLTYL